jgi:predicted AlkP superfamily phosphohydrolase/phosphomutase
VLSFPTAANAYVGPGAGFALVSSFFVLFLTFLSVVFVLLTWPIRWVFRLLFAKRPPKGARARRVVIVGLDGQDPELTEKWMDEGLLPNFSRLREKGSFHRLQTTLPAESPVAWSSFQTGCNPGRHRIFDFLVPNRKTYLPELSSAQVLPPSRFIRLGKYRIPIGRPSIRMGRKSQPFWKVLGDRGVFSSVIRVPITFPPERFHGVLLSAMSVPDLKGTQGSFFYYSTDPEDPKEFSGGFRVPVEVRDGVARSYIAGPEKSVGPESQEVRVPFQVHLRKGKSDAELVIGKKRYSLQLKKLSPYIRVGFRTGFGGKVYGLCRFCLMDSSPHLKLYMTPISIDPERPALPISHPFAYATYLSKTLGPFTTLGLAEDTNALKAGVIDEDVFLEQVYDIHAERERMLFDALEKTHRGLVVCVFDITDRLQHMFFRHLNEDHPGNRGKDASKHVDAIKDLYVRMDGLVGQVREKMNEDEVLMVMSDHGFKSFERAVNLNTWLYKKGYLALKTEEPTGSDYFQDVDWTRTRAYSVGFTGIYLNVAGRESQGVVSPGAEAETLKQKIAEGLRGLYDDERQSKVILEVYDISKTYSGPYTQEGPDLCVGFRPGYRASSLGVTGGLSQETIEDNQKDWSGDHNFNPPDVPGMLFCNRAMDAENPSIMDIGPTTLDLFGVPIPPYCDGRSLFPIREDRQP